MTKSKGKRPTDIKSFSHELDPRGLRSHEFFRPRDLGGLNDLEVCAFCCSILFCSPPTPPADVGLIFISQECVGLDEIRGLELIDIST